MTSGKSSESNHHFVQLDVAKEKPLPTASELILVWDILHFVLRRAQTLLVRRDVSRIMRKSSTRICDLLKEPPQREKEGGRVHTAEEDITMVQEVLRRLRGG